MFLDLVHATIFLPTPWISFPDELVKRSDETHPLPVQRLSEIVTRALDHVAPIYRATATVAWPLALVAFVVLGVASLWTVQPMFVVACLTVLVIASRIALLAYLEVTSMPSVNTLYLSPVYPVVLLFAAASLLGLGKAIADIVRPLVHNTVSIRTVEGP